MSSFLSSLTAKDIASYLSGAIGILTAILNFFQSRSASASAADAATHALLARTARSGRD